MDAKEIANRLLKVAKTIEDISRELTKGPAEMPAFAVERLEKEICLICHKPLSENPRERVRGLHQSCSAALSRRIKAGDITEQEAIKEGLIAPAKKPGRRKDSLIDERLRAKAEAVLKTYQASEARGDIGQAQQKVIRKASRGVKAVKAKPKLPEEKDPLPTTQSPDPAKKPKHP